MIDTVQRLPGAESMALRTRNQWLRKNPGVSLAATSMLLQPDDSLTSLNWLHNLNIFTTNTPTPSATTIVRGAGVACVIAGDNTTEVLQMLVASDVCGGAGGGVAGVDSGHTHADERVDYRSNAFVKPPYSYATLICMAMKETRRNKITLSGIYSWITENFLYYRNADPSWQNSIRHNLSLNKCFQKVARRKDEPGKGGFWKINPEYSDMFVNGIFKKRRGALSHAGMTHHTEQPLSHQHSGSMSHQLSASSAARESPSDCAHSTIDTTALSDHAPPNKRARHAHEEDEAAMASKALSVQMRGDSIFNMGADSISDVLDISWNAAACFEQNATPAKLKREVECEDIVAIAARQANAMLPMSPPLSDSTDDVTSFEDLLGGPLDFCDSPLTDDSVNHCSPVSDCIDLTVQGTSIHPPMDWWTGGPVDPAMLGYLTSRDLNTPTPSGQITDVVDENGPSLNVGEHPWAEDRLELDQALASFGPNDIFDLENVDPIHGISVGEQSWRTPRV